MSKMYKVPNETRIGHVHLKVSNIENALGFYRDILGFEITQRIGDHAVFLSAGGYHHHIGLNTWHSEGAGKASKSGVGLFHAAILYPTRKDLSEVTKRLFEKAYPITGAADHGISEAIYLNDPDGNGIELYWDRPKEEWPKNMDGTLNMFTKNLNLDDLLKI
ncbi:VOC family protein [Christiangramia forsetii]|uniref:Glyoxalase/bleomycin resistance protein/dioxygenase superfamily protein n=2 Tax=Christiangramia forsetii TaxID=411153 RepID=A0M3H1_CHRFK|nr:VOC family protein [Christiangramia forsetii]GGG25871.1 glyoxalase [Christiangramia forsetii]CAL67166.1 glyoxalase/bleomycin resistance protein/dioxygenase superfamily protein [Christiangramia forsetii KT0803]